MHFERSVTGILQENQHQVQIRLSRGAIINGSYSTCLAIEHVKETGGRSDGRLSVRLLFLLEIIF